MRILALEASGMAGSVAALEDDRILAEIELDSSRRTAQTLAPAIQDVLNQVGWPPPSVNLVSVTSGPGSFTGLRIGVTTAKTFAYATGASLVGVNTLAVIARGLTAEKPSDEKIQLWVVMNAEREQLYAASFRWDKSGWSPADSTRILDVQAWLTQLTAGALVAGLGLKDIVGRVPPTVEIAPENLWVPAANVGHEGLQAFRAGNVSDCWSLLPNYFRESAAIEKATGISINPQP